MGSNPSMNITAEARSPIRASIAISGIDPYKNLTIETSTVSFSGWGIMANQVFAATVWDTQSMMRTGRKK